MNVRQPSLVRIGECGPIINIKKIVAVIPPTQLSHLWCFTVTSGAWFYATDEQVTNLAKYLSDRALLDVIEGSPAYVREGGVP